MTLRPIKALDYVIDEHADYLWTEFRAKDAKLREAVVGGRSDECRTRNYE